MDYGRQHVRALSVQFPGVVLTGAEEDVFVGVDGLGRAGGAVVFDLMDLQVGLDGEPLGLPERGLPDGVVDGELGVEGGGVRIGSWYRDDGDAIGLSQCREIAFRSAERYRLGRDPRPGRWASTPLMMQLTSMGS